LREEKHAVFVHVSLNANKLLLPALLSRSRRSHYSSCLRYPDRKQTKHLFGFAFITLSQSHSCDIAVLHHHESLLSACILQPYQSKLM